MKIKRKVFKGWFVPKLNINRTPTGTEVRIFKHKNKMLTSIFIDVPVKITVEWKEK